MDAFVLEAKEGNQRREDSHGGITGCEIATHEESKLKNAGARVVCGKDYYGFNRVMDLELRR